MPLIETPDALDAAIAASLRARREKAVQNWQGGARLNCADTAVEINRLTRHSRSPQGTGLVRVRFRRLTRQFYIAP